MMDTHRCWVEIERAAFRHNAGFVQQRIGAAELLAIVKANAYGHGMIGVAEALTNDAKYFGVANLQEATALRAAVPHPIMILSPALPDERSTIAERGFIPSVSTLEEAEDFNRSGPIAINFKIDTGMGRMGALEANAVAIFKQVAALPKIDIHSVSTHMPVANEDADYTSEQLARFDKIVRQMRAEVPGDYKVHVLQSAGSLAFNKEPYEIVRAGIALYGISPLPEFQKLLRPAMTWKTRVGLVRDVPKGSSISYGRTFITPRAMRVVTLTAGYADGYPRHLSNRGASVLIRGRRCALLGRVTMDLMVADVSEMEDVDLGEEVVLMGKQGDEEISCAELAERAETITWDITTRIGVRVRRVYV